MVAIVDYGRGNLLSVRNALDFLGVDVAVCTEPSELESAERLVLPGVGAFGDCITRLQKAGFVEVLNDLVLRRRRPILGICLGMQLMATKGFEFGEHTGLGWFKAEVRRITPADAHLRVPQIGWNSLSYKKDVALFAGLPESPDFYFVHSYHVVCADDRERIATCDYGGPVTAAIMKGNICATQFHPEKSQDHGLRLLENFLRWTPDPCSVDG